ncbi:MAG: 2-C-methyl-D-erythritol 4-phosphate cytidylyltransferase [Nitrospinae bacterium]|nr:2-C-methyl-D-erythritol 4-phosphate cytidylyltransferase [Nitrospinota bacterium]
MEQPDSNAIPGKGQTSVTAIIPAAGAGTRMGGAPKQYRELGGKPILEWTLAALSNEPSITAVILAVPPDDVDRMGKKYLNSSVFPKVTRVVAGGAKRWQSVRNGVMAADTEYALIHDAARPFTSGALIRGVVESAVAHGAATAAVPAHDTVKTRDGERLGALVDRATLLLIQTPQAFRRELLLNAYEALKGNESDWTDETSLVQAAGFPVAWVPGESTNLKITTPEDFVVAQLLAGTRNS